MEFGAESRRRFDHYDRDQVRSDRLDTRGALKLHQNENCLLHITDINNKQKTDTVS